MVFQACLFYNRIMQHKDAAPKKKNQAAFSLFIREEFLRRCKNNPSYSLRSFARQLKVDASLLSKILRGNRQASAQFIQLVGPSIGLKPRQLSELLKDRENIQYDTLGDDIFTVISDWFHFALLELIKTEGFVTDPAWIAKRLSIHKTEAETALERLERLEFIELKNGIAKIRSQHNTWANNEMTSMARKQLQKQLAIKAVAAIEEVPFDLRESGSLTIACPKNLIPELKNKIKNFRREIDEFVEAHEKPDEVYQLVVSLYPLTKV